MFLKEFVEVVLNAVGLRLLVDVENLAVVVVAVDDILDEDGKAIVIIIGFIGL